jgi:hypothetical protein
MSILDKHPAPWTCSGGILVDGNGSWLADDLHLAEQLGSDSAKDAVERLILAAPVLLECVRAFVSDDCPNDLTPFNILLSNIEGDGECSQCSQLDIATFLAWLKGRGPAPKSKAKQERDELLESLKEVAQVFATEGPQNILPLRFRIHALLARVVGKDEIGIALPRIEGGK